MSITILSGLGLWLLGNVAFVLLLRFRAPVGYQDSNGFHFGRNPNSNLE